ncbi:MAG: branched-chain amino acid aminotransferase [Clostridiales bacterium]|jgi:branched-chain amino acid aminotransferase|nr:branched-chain amino acid aminotransferase [Clostridiales bacterium]
MDIKIEHNKNLKVKPDQSNLGFGKYFTDHMFIMDYKNGAWCDARIIPYAPLELDPAVMVLHYGQAVFEGLKCYRAKGGGLNLFRPEKNFERLNKSDERLCIPQLDVDFAIKSLKELIKIDESWVPSEPGTSLYIRPFVIATEIGVGVHPSSEYMFIIILSPVGAYYKEGLNPVKICIENEYVRAVRGGIGFTKATANYASSLKGQEKAKGLGYSQVLWLDGVERKYIEEVGTMNVFFKIGGEVITPELNGSILPGITRDSVIEMLRVHGIKVVERKIAVSEIFEAAREGKLEEAFGTGTAAVISPIGEFSMGGEKVSINNGKIGSLSQKLYDNLTGVQYGAIEDHFNWITTIDMHV